MDNKRVIFVIISSLLLAAIYSSTSSVVFALKAHTPTLCEKTTANGITTENCCHFETDSKTEKITEYCTDCKTTSSGVDMGCTHTQTDVGLTMNQGVLDVKPISPPRSTEQLSNNKLPKDFDLKEDGLLTKDTQSITNDSQITTNKESSPTPPTCPEKGPIPPDCTMKPLLK